MSESRTLLEVRGLKQYFDINMGFFRTRPLKAVDDVSFSINKGEIHIQACRASVNDTAHGRPVRLAKGGESENVSDGIHGGKNNKKAFCPCHS